jgi:hypothetical protein
MLSSQLCSSVLRNSAIYITTNHLTYKCNRVARHNKHCPPTSASSSAPLPSSDDPPPLPPPAGIVGWWKTQQAKTAELRSKLASLGLAAILAYGMFDGLSYTIAFSIAFLGYEAQTGLNPTQNVADIIKICILMWAGNNVTRPFRLAGAAALAPFMDTTMIRIQQKLRLPSKFWAFALVVAAVASICLGIVGALFLSRWVVA